MEWNETERRRLFKALEMRRYPGQEQGLSSKNALYTTCYISASKNGMPATHVAGLCPSHVWERLGYAHDDRISCMLYLLQTGWCQAASKNQREYATPLLYDLMRGSIWDWKLSGEEIDKLIQAGCAFRSTPEQRRYGYDLGTAAHVAATFQSPLTLDQLNTFLKYGINPRERGTAGWSGLDVLETIIMAKAKNWIKLISLAAVRELVSMGCNLEYNSERHVFENRDASKNYRYGHVRREISAVLSDQKVCIDYITKDD